MEKTIHQAWVECQQEFENPKRSAPANWGSYAPLDEILDVFVPILNKHGFSFRHTVLPSEKGRELLAIATFVDGNTISSVCPLPDKFDSMQDIGACITYGRRYTSGMIFGVEGARDIDHKKTNTELKNTFNANPITEAQVGRFWRLARKPGLTDPIILNQLNEKYGFKLPAEITRDRFQEITDYFEAWDGKKQNIA